MEISVNYSQLNLLLSDIERYASTVESLSEQVASQPLSSSLLKTAPHYHPQVTPLYLSPQTR